MHNTIKHITPLGNYDVPTGWPMKPYKRPYGGTPGPPVMYEKPSDPEDESAGYGYSNGMQQKERDVFYYHSDHLGSISYITDRNGNATQFVCYKPYGEALVDEHATSFEQPWKFNGKELDAETGLYYYGARYYEPVLALWYGVDKLAEKYPSIGGYVYCAGNPVGIIDPDGNGWFIVCGEDGEQSFVYRGDIWSQNDLMKHNIDGQYYADIFVGLDENGCMSYYSLMGEIIGMNEPLGEGADRCQLGKAGFVKKIDDFLLNCYANKHNSVSFGDFYEYQDMIITTFENIHLLNKPQDLFFAQKNKQGEIIGVSTIVNTPGKNAEPSYCDPATSKKATQNTPKTYGGYGISGSEPQLRKGYLFKIINEKNFPLVVFSFPERKRYINFTRTLEYLNQSRKK